MASNITQNYLSIVGRNTIMNVEQEFIKEFCFSILDCMKGAVVILQN